MKAASPLAKPKTPTLGNEPIYHWIDGKRHRWERYSNRYHTSRCMFYLVLDPEETS